MATGKKKAVMASEKKKPVKKTAVKKIINKGFKVSYSMQNHLGKWKRDETKIVYRTKQEAQSYADQLNRVSRFKNARVKKA